MLERIKKWKWKDVDWKKLDYPRIALTAVFLLAMKYGDKLEDAVLKRLER